MNFEAEILAAPHDNSGIWEKNQKNKKEIKVNYPLHLLSLQIYLVLETELEVVKKPNKQTKKQDTTLNTVQGKSDIY